ncbi:hypothetical protein GCM10011512_02930 [Tersicoccus solisilvae]|uniref:Integral membrane protein n=1 Tax=Tersicoccus solisilvae TaxID=1882339 RepID=A0ABQ1NLM2_9MICC|nr:hypothetical protein [Tersicoccus solisilvae]GGC79725.1 hypothetical protein GCM10011512_02930 [Tersicoccus solisilvae]
MRSWLDTTRDDDRSDAWRWNRAEREAERVPVPDLRPAFRRFVLVEVPGLLALGVGLAVAVALLRGGEENDLWLAARWGLVVAGLAVAAAGVVHSVRNPWGPHVLGVLTPRQRKSVHAQIRGRVGVADRELTVVRAAAQGQQAQALRTPFTLASTVAVAASLLANPRVLPALVLFLLLVLVAAAVVGWWQYRQASAFLRRHPAPRLSDIDEAGE